MKKLFLISLLISLFFLPLTSYSQIWERNGGKFILEGFTSSEESVLSETHISSSSGGNVNPPSPITQFNYHVRISTYYGVTLPEGETRGIEYRGDTVSMLPVTVDGDIINNWNDNSTSWKSFVYSIAKPCMLRFDGTVDYYLDPEDQTKKLDGTDSDLVSLESASAYQGNAMVELRPIWISLSTQFRSSGIVDIDDRCEDFIDIKIADHQIDNTYFCHAFTREDGSLSDKIYLGMYEGSLDENNKIRSIPCLESQIYTNVSSATTIIEACRANGNNYYSMYGSLLTHLQVLHILISKSVDSKASFGNGHFHSYASSAVDLGLYRNKGCFYGTHSDFTNGVKSFWCENLWGNKAVLIDGIKQSGDRIYFSNKPPFTTYEQANWQIAQYTHTPDIGKINCIGCSNGFIFPSRVDYSNPITDESSTCGYGYTQLSNSCTLHGSWYGRNGSVNGILTQYCHGFRDSILAHIGGCRLAYIPPAN